MDRTLRVLALLGAFGLVVPAAKAISQGDAWAAIEGKKSVFLVSAGGTLLAETTAFPATPKALAANCTDGSVYVGASNGRIYRVAPDGSFALFADLANDPTGVTPNFVSISIAPAAAGGGIYALSAPYGDWALYRILPDGSIPWAVCPGRADNAASLAVDQLTGNAVMAVSGDKTMGIHSYQDGSRIGGQTGMSATGIVAMYQQDGSCWIKDTSTTISRFAAGTFSGAPLARYYTSSPQALSVDPRDGSLWMLIGTGTSTEIVHLAATGVPAAELARFGLGSLNEAKRIEIDPVSGNVWVADRRNGDVVKFAPDGTQLVRYKKPNGGYVDHLAVYNPPVDLSGASSTNRVYADRAPLNTGTHPRLFVTLADLPAIRQRVQQNPWAQWYAELKTSADAMLAAPITPFPYTASGVWATRAMNAHYLAFVGLVEDDPAYLAKARLNLTWKRWAGAASPYGDEMTASDIGMHVALGYDMVYSVLSDVDEMGLEGCMEQIPRAGYNRLNEGGWYSGWGWGSNVGTKTGAGMGLIGLAIGPTNAAWAQDYLAMAQATVEDGLNRAFDAEGFYGEGQGYLATGWYNALHTLLALRKTGGTDYWADARFQRWQEALARTCTPLGTIPQFEDASLTGGYMMMSTSLPLSAALMPAAKADVKSWCKFAYELTDVGHPYQGSYYSVSTYDPSMAISAIDEAAWNGVTAAPAPNFVLPARYPNGGRGNFVLRTGLDADDDIQVTLSATYQNGWPASTHEHMDNGAMEMFAYGTRLLVSPGYSASSGTICDWQDSTLAASTLICDRNRNGLFDVVEDRQDGGSYGAGSGPLERAAGEQIGLVCSHYDPWYGSTVSFTRNVLLVGKAGDRAPYCVVIDDVESPTTPRQLAITWHCRGSAVQSAAAQADWTVPSDIGGDPVTMTIQVVKPDSLAVSLNNGMYYPFYGSSGTAFEEVVPYLVAEASGANSYRFLSLLYPRKSGELLPAIAGLSGVNAATVGAADLIFTQDEQAGGGYSTVTIAGVTTDAELGFVRKNGDDDIDGLIAKQATSLDFGGAGFSSSNPVSLALLHLAGAVETYATGTTLTVRDRNIRTAATVEVDGNPVAATVTDGTAVITIPGAGAHSLRILSPRVIGDIDGDGHVNIFDIFAIAEHWNTEFGDPDFDPACDLDDDGAINIFDIFVIAENWNA